MKNLNYLDKIAKNALEEIKIPNSNNWEMFSEKMNNNNFSANNSLSQFFSKMSSFFTSKITIVGAIIFSIVSLSALFVTQENTSSNNTKAKKCINKKITTSNNRQIVSENTINNEEEGVNDEINNENTDIQDNIVANLSVEKNDSTNITAVVIKHTRIVRDTLKTIDTLKNH